MEEFVELLRAFGRALLKVLIGVAVGFGVGLLTIGIRALGAPTAWQHSEPPLAEIFLGIGAGLLSSAAMLILLFYLPWSKKPPAIRERDKDGPPRDVR